MVIWEDATWELTNGLNMWWIELIPLTCLNPSASVSICCWWLFSGKLDEFSVILRRVFELSRFTFLFISSESDDNQSKYKSHSKVKIINNSKRSFAYLTTIFEILALFEQFQHNIHKPEFITVNFHGRKQRNNSEIWFVSLKGKKCGRTQIWMKSESKQK